MNRTSTTKPHSNQQCTAFLSLESNYISWVRNVVNIYNGSMAIFISAILVSQSDYPLRIKDTLATGLMVVGFIGLIIGLIWHIGSILEFRTRRNAFLQNKLDFRIEKTTIWKYINAILYFLVLLFLIFFIPIIIFILK